MAASRGAQDGWDPGRSDGRAPVGTRAVPAERSEALGFPPHPGPERGREGARARGMLGSVKMEAHDLAEWSYYPEAGEVCPRGWRSGKRGAGIRVRA